MSAHRPQAVPLHARPMSQRTAECIFAVLLVTGFLVWGTALLALLLAVTYGLVVLLPLAFGLGRGF